MTLDEAIKHCEDVVGANEVLGDAECAADHRQLAEWLKELKEAKRLLKLAVEDIESLKPYLAEPYCRLCSDKWRYADEAKKLLGEEI